LTDVSGEAAVVLSAVWTVEDAMNERRMDPPEDAPACNRASEPVDAKRRAALAKLGRLSGVGGASAIAVLTSARTAAAS